jgi:hypothetical protein
MNNPLQKRGNDASFPLNHRDSFGFMENPKLKTATRSSVLDSLYFGDGLLLGQSLGGPVQQQLHGPVQLRVLV